MAALITGALRTWSACNSFIALSVSLLNLIHLLMSLAARLLFIGLVIVFLIILAITILFNSHESRAESSCSSNGTSAGNILSNSTEDGVESAINGTASADRSYDVFVNHCGKDVKRSFASIIYNWLEDKGLRVFLDQEEFKAGEGLNQTIQQAIRSASVHIAVFSRNYADSSWCLNELCLMSESGGKIIPVFFDVKPSDLRWIGQGKSAYDDAFAGHLKKGRHDLQKVQEWKARLEHMSYQHGLELNGQKFNGDWGKLLKSIVDAVVEARVEKVDLDVAAVPVGLDEAIQHFQNFMERAGKPSENEKVKIVGIVGLGGSGKTTLAKEFYNRQRRSSFQRCSFLFSVRDAAARNALVTLQSQLLKDLLPADRSKIDSLAQGKGILRNGLASSSPRVLIVLDDVDNESQFEDLLAKDVFGRDSLIIITSREKSALLPLMPESAVYKIKELNEEQAQMLFCSSAFQNPHPASGFEDLVRKFLSKCQGLPLFLKLMGAHLRAYGKDNKDCWEEELRNITRIPPQGIKQMLQVSYDKLDYEEKQIFLDIACFFVGEDKNLAIRVWDASTRMGSTHLKNLECKSLVEFDEENHIKMHDHFRDLGRDIASREPPYRLCHPDHLIINVEEQGKRRRQVRGIMAATSGDNYEYYQPPWEETDLVRLRLLIIQGNCLESRFGRLLRNLIWLRWYDFPHTNIPPWLSIKNLTVLHLINAGRFRNWQPCDEQLPLQLKELKIQFTQLSMISIPKEVCPKLEHLDLSNNKRLIEVRHLPTKLVELNLNGCIALNTISGSFDLEYLQELDIGGCSELDDRLPSLAHLSSLKRLHAQLCRKLRSIQGLEHLVKLQTLDIGGCSKLNTLPNLQHLRSLETIIAVHCKKLRKIEGLEHLAKLQWLGISCCSELHELPNLSRLSSLERLEADGCLKLQGIQGLDQLVQLKILCLPASQVTATWNSIQQLKKLPSEMHLDGTMSGAGLKSFCFLDLPIIDLTISADEYNYYAYCNRPDLTARAENSWSAVMILFVTRRSDGVVPTERHIGANLSPRGNVVADWNTTDGSIRKGDWIDISIFSHDSFIVKNLNRENPTTEFSLRKLDKNVNSVKGWMMMVSEGHEGKILEVLSKIFNQDTTVKTKTG